MAIKDLKSELKMKFVEQLTATNCIKFGDFKMKSGGSTSYYVNLREATMYTELFDVVVELLKEVITERLRQSEIKEAGDSSKKVAIVGVPYGVVPVAAAVAHKCKLAYFPDRKEVKNYGFRADLTSFDNFDYIIVEDVISTGSSIIETLDRMKGKNITDIIVIVDREVGGENNLRKKYPHIRFHSILKVSEVLVLKDQIQEKHVV